MFLLSTDSACGEDELVVKCQPALCPAISSRVSTFSVKNVWYERETYDPDYFNLYGTGSGACMPLRLPLRKLVVLPRIARLASVGSLIPRAGESFLKKSLRGLKKKAESAYHALRTFTSM